jgi:membrane-associated phospholipid phosphatase
MEMTILAWWWSRRISTPLAVIYGLYSVCMLLATTYLRYHYTVDLLAGVVAAVAVLTVAPRLIRWWQ